MSFAAIIAGISSVVSLGQQVMTLIRSSSGIQASPNYFSLLLTETNELKASVEQGFASLATELDLAVTELEYNAAKLNVNPLLGAAEATALKANDPTANANDVKLTLRTQMDQFFKTEAGTGGAFFEYLPRVYRMCAVELRLAQDTGEPNPYMDAVQRSLYRTCVSRAVGREGDTLPGCWWFLHQKLCVTSNPSQLMINDLKNYLSGKGGTTGDRWVQLGRFINLYETMVHLDEGVGVGRLFLDTIGA